MTPLEGISPKTNILDHYFWTILSVNFRRILIWLLSGALFLPIAIVLLAGLGRLLAALGDTDGARLLDRAALVAGILWALTLVGLPIVLALQSLTVEAPHDEDELGA
jgi:hypothetical protein